MKKVVIIGSGNVAEAFALALAERGAAPVQIFARNAAEGRALAAHCGAGYAGEPARLAPADLYLIAVSDRAIAPVSASLDFGNAVVAHTSGSTPLDALAAKIRHRAVLYPLQSFTKGRRVDFREIYDGQDMLHDKEPRQPYPYRARLFSEMDRWQLEQLYRRFVGTTLVGPFVLRHDGLIWRVLCRFRWLLGLILGCAGRRKNG